MVKIELTFPSIDAALLALSGIKLASAPEPIQVTADEKQAVADVAADTSKPKETRGRPRKDPQTEAAGKPAQAPEPDPAPAQAQPAAASEGPKAPVVTYDEVREAIMSLAEAKGRGASVALLATFGVKSGKDLAADKYAEVVKAAEAAKAAEELA